MKFHFDPVVSEKNMYKHIDGSLMNLSVFGFKVNLELLYIYNYCPIIINKSSKNNDLIHSYIKSTFQKCSHIYASGINFDLAIK